MKRLSFVAFATFACMSAAHGQLTPTAPQQVSVGIGGTAPDGKSDKPAVPPNAEIVVFQSTATNLIAGDSNNVTDIFLADANNSLSRVSVSSTGEQSNGRSEEPAISPVFPDGSYAVAFASNATNLVPELGIVPEARKQIYLRIPAIGKTVLVSRSLNAGNLGGNGDSTHASVTAVDEKEGRRYLVAYTTLATDVASDSNGSPGSPNNPANPSSQIVFAVVNGQDGSIMSTSRYVSSGAIIPNGSFFNPVLSGRGDALVFLSTASNLGFDNAASYAQVLLAKKGSKELRLVSAGPDGAAGSLSSDSPSISFNGDFIGFTTSAYNILNSSASNQSAALYTSANGSTSLVNQNAQGIRGTGGLVFGSMINRNGRLATFVDSSDVFVLGDTNKLEDVFVKDIAKGSVVRINTSATGAQSDGPSRQAVIGGSGYNRPTAQVAFYSEATTLATAGNGTVGNVYRVRLTVPPPPLTKTTKIENPPDVIAGKKKLSLVLQEFDLTSSAASSLDSSVRASANTATYDIRLLKLGSKKGVRRGSKTNKVTLRNLTAGKYTLRYRVTGKVSGKTVTTGYSPTITVVVTG
jgi:hypothetical protein